MKYNFISSNAPEKLKEIPGQNGTGTNNKIDCTQEQMQITYLTNKHWLTYHNEMLTICTKSIRETPLSLSRSKC